MKIINNTTEKLADDLRVTIKKRSRVSMAAACFSVYAFEELKAQLENLDELRFIFTSPAFLDEKPKKAQREFYIPRLNRERTLHGSEFEIKLRSEFRQRAISQECAHWIREKARFKSNKTMEGMTGFLTVDSDSPVAYAPVNGFTREDLGCDRGGRMFSMINRVDFLETAMESQDINCFCQKRNLKDSWQILGSTFWHLTKRPLERLNPYLEIQPFLALPSR